MEKIIDEVYQALKDRDIHPSGTFDNGGRFYAANQDLIFVRAPARKWPFSHMQACRTKKYVEKVCAKFDCQTLEELKGRV